jgi:hypothetical protein
MLTKALVCLLVLLIGSAIVAVLAAMVMLAWNWAAPLLWAAAPVITYAQAAAVMILLILFRALVLGGSR